jgi:hypothetical protein
MELDLFRAVRDSVLHHARYLVRRLRDAQEFVVPIDELNTVDVMREGREHSVEGLERPQSP